MKRLLVLLSVALFATAAPARAWCEASCLAPAGEATPHCPSQDHDTTRPVISGSAIGDCPIIESARPATPARLDVQAPELATTIPLRSIRSTGTVSAVRPFAATTVFERCTPLRI